MLHGKKASVVILKTLFFALLGNVALSKEVAVVENSTHNFSQSNKPTFLHPKDLVDLFGGNNVVSQGSTGKSCNPNLSYLSAFIPEFKDPEINKIREQTLNTSVAEAMGNARRLGATTNDVIMSLRQNIIEMEASAKSGSQAYSAVVDSTKENFSSNVKINGYTDKLLCVPGSISSNILCTVIINKIGAIGLRSLIADLKCADTK